MSGSQALLPDLGATETDAAAPEPDTVTVPRVLLLRLLRRGDYMVKALRDLRVHGATVRMWDKTAAQVRQEEEAPSCQE